MTNQQFINEFIGAGEGASGRQGNLSYRDGVLYSYSMPIGVKDGGTIWVNRDRSSVTTSTHQNMLAGSIGWGHYSFEIPFSLLEEVGKVEEFDIIDISGDTALLKHSSGYYLAGLDEKSQYFLTEIPGEALDLQEARNQLMPDEVQEAPYYERQGEYYFVPMEGSIPSDVDIEKFYHIDDGTHYATRGFEHEGEVYVKGCIRHEKNEHSMLKLYEDTNDRSWYKVYESQRGDSWSMNGGSINYD